MTEERWTPEEFMSKASWYVSWFYLAAWGGRMEDEVPLEIEYAWFAFADAYANLEARRKELALSDPDWEWQ